MSSYPKSSARKPNNPVDMLGQVFTPSNVAEEMAKLLFSKATNNGVYSVLDPSVGPTTFPKAIIENDLLSKESSITTIDIDCAMTSLTNEWLNSKKINHNTINVDYLEYELGCKFDFVIFNPPYIRQEWIECKQKYQFLFKERYNISVPGTSNLYVYFVVKAILDLKIAGTFVCVLYDSWKYTIYGKWLENFIKQTCRDIEIYPLDDQPFEGRLINATIIKGVKVSEQTKHARYSITCAADQLSEREAKVDGFLPIQSVFNVKRGLRLKQSDFFLSDDSMINLGATPFLKKVGKIRGFRVPDQHAETALLVWNTNMDDKIINELERRLKIAKMNPSENISVLSWYSEHPDTWFVHSEPPYSKLVFNYYIRNRPRHVFNPDRAFSDNFYGLSISDTKYLYAYIAILNATAVCNDIVDCSRKQGNGLYKIQLYEYRNVFIPDISTIGNKEIQLLCKLGKLLVEPSQKPEGIIREIDCLLWSIYRHDKLNPDCVKKSLESKIQMN